MIKAVLSMATRVRVSREEAVSVCKLGQESECCAFLCADPSGFICARGVSQLSVQVVKRLAEGSMVAQGIGGYPGCAFESEIKEGLI